MQDCNMDKVVVRDAVLEDAAAMGRVHVRSWQAAYVGIMPQSALDALEDAERASNWREAIERNPVLPAARRLVVEVGGQVVGIALVGRDREFENGLAVDNPLSEIAMGEVVLIYLEPEVWGQGIGSKLLAVCVESLVGLGYLEAVLWVGAENRRARRFYEREGWHFDGAEKVEIMEGVEVSEIRYRRLLRED